VPKLFLIGDSFVHGACIPDMSKTISGWLSSEFKAVNLGTGSNGPIHYASLLKAFMPHFNAEYIVMAFYPNDNSTSFLDNQESYFYNFYWEDRFEPYLETFEGKKQLNQSLVAFYDELTPLLTERVVADINKNVSEVDSSRYYEKTADEVYLDVKSNSHYFTGLVKSNALLEKIRSIASSFFELPDKDLSFANKLAIDELERVCKDGCSPLIVFMPNSELWRPDSRALIYKEKLEEYALIRGIKFVDTTSRLREHSDSEIYSVKGPHLSPLGYSIVADLIEENLGAK
jgi:hypothetical protein